MGKKRKKRKQQPNKLLVFLIAVVIAVCSYLFDLELPSVREVPATTAELQLEFPADRYPETAAHIREAIAKGHSAVCTIDRDGANKNRDESLRGIPTKPGYDRDEWPMAMCAEGGEGASVSYIDPSDNRGAGAWVSNQLEEYPDGTRVLFVIDE